MSTYDMLSALPVDTEKQSPDEAELLDIVLVKPQESASWMFWMFLVLAYIITSIPIFDNMVERMVGGKQTLTNRLTILSIKVVLFLGIFYVMNMWS